MLLGSGSAARGVLRVGMASRKVRVGLAATQIVKGVKSAVRKRLVWG
jgi:hypothetical protein